MKSFYAKIITSPDVTRLAWNLIPRKCIKINDEKLLNMRSKKEKNIEIRIAKIICVYFSAFPRAKLYVQYHSAAECYAILFLYKRTAWRLVVRNGHYSPTNRSTIEKNGARCRGQPVCTCPRNKYQVDWSISTPLYLFAWFARDTRRRDENSVFPNASPLVKTGYVYSPTHGISFAIYVVTCFFSRGFLPTDAFFATLREHYSAREEEQRR